MSVVPRKNQTPITGRVKEADNNNLLSHKKPGVSRSARRPKNEDVS